MRPWNAISVLALVAACALDRDEALIRFDPDAHPGIQPELDVDSGAGDYSLMYVLAADGASIRARFLGPSEALSAGIGTERMLEGDEHVLVCRVGGSDFRAVLARWKLDASGRVCDARVRTRPIVEIRPFGKLEPGQLAVGCEWRPLVDGKGSGPWRPPPGR